MLRDKLSADVVLLGELGDGLSGEGVQDELLSYGWGQPACACGLK